VIAVSRIIQVLTSIDRALLRGLGSIASSDEANDMRVICQPAVASDLEEVGALPWVRHEYPLEQVPRMRCDIFGEGEWCRNNVLVQEVDIVTLWVRRIVVERQITCQHGVLSIVSAECGNGVDRLTRMTPQLHTSTLQPV
jgi:hypothetical protein